MKILVFGCTGMLGHRLFVDLPAYGHDVWGTARSPDIAGTFGLDTSRIRQFDALRFDTLGPQLDEIRPDVAINCIGVIKQRPEALDPDVAIPINAWFPHRVAAECERRSIRMIHISTDCVFSGTDGPYDESARPAPDDLYGRTKLIGEVADGAALTLRTSIIGHELGNGLGLLSWILSNRGMTVKGFDRALFSGVTTNFMVEAINRICSSFPHLAGLWHVSADHISKYELVSLVSSIYGLDITVLRDDSVAIDRRLVGDRLRSECDIAAPDWCSMITTMRDSFAASSLDAS